MSAFVNSCPEAGDDDAMVVDERFCATNAYTCTIVNSPVTTQQSADGKAKQKSLDSLADELLREIIMFLTPRDVLKCETLGTRWREAALWDELWLLHVRQIWKKTGFHEQWTPPSIPLLQRIRNCCSITEMRKGLSSYDTTALVEKSDFVLLLRSKLLFGIRACVRNSRGYVPPPWTAELNDGKAAWVFAKKESKRTNALESELFISNFDLYYNQSPTQPFEVIFYKDGEMTAGSHGDTRFHWHLNTAPGFEGVQIESFPLHTFSRDDSGAWELSNAHVVMRQRKGDWDPAKLPLL